MENNLLNKREYQKQYRVAGVVIFAMSVLVLLARIMGYYMSGLFSGLNEYLSEFVLDAIFSVTVQVVILFLMPFLVYKFVLKKSAKEVFGFSNFRKTKPVNLLLAIFIGALGIIVSIGISFAWQIILILFGYAPTSSASVLPDTFNIWLFLGSIFLTAVLPGFCEEFTMRGGFLTALRSAFPLVTVVIVSAMSFGLFHQYISQTLYTAFFGGMMAFITIRTKSIYPAMIIHFTNNGLSVYLDYAEKYGWLGGNFYNNINDMLMDGQLGALFFIYVAIFIAFSLLIYLLIKLNPKEVPQPVMLNGNPPSPAPSRPTFYAENLDKYTVKKSPPLELDRKIMPRAVVQQSVYGGYNPAFTNAQNDERILFINNRYYLLKNNILHALKLKVMFKPKLSDNIFYIGAIVVSSLSTIFTLVWGFIM